MERSSSTSRLIAFQRALAIQDFKKGYHGRERDEELRPAGTKKVHVFTGERVQVDKPAGAPAWMGDKIWKPQVKKVGIETLEEV